MSAPTTRRLRRKFPATSRAFRSTDNATVHAGDVIATIDDGDYRLAADAAREKVATQQATVDRIGRQVVAQEANVDQAKAQMVSAQAEAKKDAARIRRGSRRWRRRNSPASRRSNRRRRAATRLPPRSQSAQAVIDAAAANLDVLKAQQQEAARTLDELRTAQAKAERDLSFTVIRAPVDGVFSNRAVQTGDYVQTGQRVASLVPLKRRLYRRQLQGDAARPDPPRPAGLDQRRRAARSRHQGPRRQSLSPASGSVFSLLPPDNATGNFTKIVQRLPVRIEVPAGVAAQRVLRPGMSVVVSVNTKPGPAARRRADLAGKCRRSRARPPVRSAAKQMEQVP